LTSDIKKNRGDRPRSPHLYTQRKGGPATVPQKSTWLQFPLHHALASKTADVPAIVVLLTHIALSPLDAGLITVWPFAPFVKKKTRNQK
jgi:hypothetical protein